MNQPEAHVLPPTSQAAVASYLRDRSYVSYSQLSSYRDCPRKFALHYIEKVTEIPQGPLIMGRVVHQAVEDGELLSMWRHPKAEAEMTEHVRKLARDAVEEVGGPDRVRWGGRKDTIRRDEDGKEVKGEDGKNVHAGEDYLWWHNFGGPQCVRRWIDTRLDDRARGWEIRLEADGKPSVEVRRTIVLPTGKPLYSIMDGFLFTDGKRSVIRDYKTGQVGKASQAQLEVYAYSEILETGEVPAAEFVYLRSNDVVKRRQEITIHPYVVKEVPAQFEWFESALATGLFPVNPDTGWKCKACTVKNWCPVGAELQEVVADA